MKLTMKKREENEKIANYEKNKTLINNTNNHNNNNNNKTTTTTTITITTTTTTTSYNQKQNTLTMRNIPKLHHIIDLPPAMLTNPSVSAASVRIETGTHCIETGVVRRPNPVVLILSVDPVLVPVIRRHNAGVAIRKGEHVRDSHLWN